MNKLVTHVKSIAIALISIIKNFKISDLKGEDVNVVVVITRFRDAQERLHAFLMMPHDLEQIFIIVYQTTTVQTFNEMFDHEARQLILNMMDDMQQTYQQVRFHIDVTAVQQSTILEKCELIHRIAGTFYIDMVYQ